MTQYILTQYVWAVNHSSPYTFVVYAGPGGWNDLDFLMTGGQVHM